MEKLIELTDQIVDETGISYDNAYEIAKDMLRQNG